MGKTEYVVTVRQQELRLELELGNEYVDLKGFTTVSKIKLRSMAGSFLSADGGLGAP